MKTDCLLIHKDDNVVVALKPLAKGKVVTAGGETILLKTGIPAGHKSPRRQIGKGENVIRYGHPIGHATTGDPCRGVGAHPQPEDQPLGPWIIRTGRSTGHCRSRRQTGSFLPARP